MSEFEIMTGDFYGRTVRFHRDGEHVWFTAEQAAGPLGLSSAKQVRKLFANHKAEFLADIEYGYPTLAVAYSNPSEGPEGMRRQKVLVFSLQGIDHLALLVRNEVGVKVRRWTVDLRQALRNREKAIVDPVKLAEKVLDLQRQLNDAHERHKSDLRRVTDQLLGNNEALASALGAAFRMRRYQKEREAALRAELEIGQRFFFAREHGDAPAVAGN